jgi:hypothetical protein
MEICEVFMIPSRKVKAGDTAGIFSAGHPGSAGDRQKARTLAMAQTGTQTGLLNRRASSPAGASP